MKPRISINTSTKTSTKAFTKAVTKAVTKAFTKTSVKVPLQIAALFAFALAIILVCTRPAIAAPEKKVPLTFAVVENEYSYIDKVLYRCFTEMGYDFNVAPLGVTSAIISADNGQYDGLGTQSAGLEAVYPNLIMITEPVGEVVFKVFAKEGSTAKIDSWEDFSNHSVGHTFQRYYIQSHLPSDASKKSSYKTLEELFQGVQEGEVEYAVFPMQTQTKSQFKGMVEVGAFDKQFVYTYLNKNSAHLAEELTQKIIALKESGEFDDIISNKRSSSTFGKKKFLFISSYGEDRQDSYNIGSEIRKTLTRRQENEVYTVDLNSTRFTDKYSSYTSTMNFIRAKYLSGNPDVIIVANHIALDFIKANYNSNFEGIPVVFCGISGFDTELIEGFEDRFTGIAESVSAGPVIEAILKLFPDTKKIFVINDYSYEGIATKKEIERKAESYEKIVEIEYSTQNSLSELLEAVSKLPSKTVVLCGDYVEDPNGEFYSEKSMQHVLSGATKLPIFGLRKTDIGYGQLGGKYINSSLHGQVAADMAERLASRASVQSVPINSDTDSFNEWIFDFDELVKFGLSNDKTPKNLKATILNEPKTFADVNPYAIKVLTISAMLVSALLMTLFIMLVILGKKNMQLTESQKSLHTAEELLEKENLIRKTKQQTEKILDLAPLIYVHSIDGIIIDSNKYAQEVIGMYPGDEMQNFYLDTAERDRLIEKLDYEYSVASEVVQFITLTNDINRFLINVSQIDDESGGKSRFLWGINIEKSERQRDSIERTQEDMQKLIDALPVSLYIFDPISTQIIYSNASFANMVGFDKMENLIGVSAYDFLPTSQESGENSIALFGDFVDSIIQSDVPLQKEITLQMPSGELFDSKVICSNFVYIGIYAVIVMVQDISADKKKTHLLEKIAESEKEANELKSRFIVNMSHEIRTPMNAIIGLSEIELSKPKDKEAFDVFRKINVSAKNLLSIVNDILDFSKIEAEKLEIVEGNFVLEEMLSDAMVVSAQRIDNKDVEMIADISTDLPTSLIGDRTRLWQILKNLLDNASKFTSLGYVVLFVRNLGVDGNLRNIIEFEVMDTGVGMKPETIEKIFTPFEQHHENTIKTEGTGLGMSITKQLTDIMGGSIKINSEFGVGTCAIVTLPLMPVPQAQTLQDMLRRPEFKGKRVLVVDDSLFVCDMMDSFLRSLEMVPECVSNSQEALETIKAAQSKGFEYDIMILDLVLNDGVDGIKLGAKIKEVSKTPPKLILITAYSKRLIHEEYSQVGFIGIVEKPFVPSNLVEKMCEALNIEYQYYESEQRFQFTGAKVLLAEDNLINQDVALGMLEMFDIVPDIANDGREALQMLDEKHYDMILMDILMPIMSGHEATVIIRESDKPYKDIPIVAMTANAMLEEVNKCREEGMNGHVSKPIDLDKLYDELMKWLPKYAKAPAEPDKSAAAEALKQEAQKTSAEFEVPGLDIKDGMKRFANKQAKYEKALRSFSSDLRKGIGEIESAANAGDYKTGRELSHRHKGVAGNLGAKDLYDVAAVLESQFIKEIYDREVFDKFKKMSIDMCDNIDGAFAQRAAAEETPVVKSAGDDREAYEILKGLKGSLEQFDPTISEELVEKLKEKTWSTIDAKSVNEVSDFIEGYQFEDAAEIVLRLLVNEPEGGAAEAAEAAEKPEDFGSDEEFKQILTELLESLAQFDPTVCEELSEKLLARKWKDVDRSKLEEVYDLVEVYEFDKTAEIVTDLLGGKQ